MSLRREKQGGGGRRNRFNVARIYTFNAEMQTKKMQPKRMQTFLSEKVQRHKKESIALTPLTNIHRGQKKEYVCIAIERTPLIHTKKAYDIP